MNKHGRIIEIRGFRGILTALFIFCCLFTGFTVFPGYIIMNIWNLFTPYITDMPQMHLLHGAMLWAIIFLIWFAFNGKMPSFHMGNANRMDEAEIREFVAKMKKEQTELMNNQEKEQSVEKEEK